VEGRECRGSVIVDGGIMECFLDVTGNGRQVVAYWIRINFQIIIYLAIYFKNIADIGNLTY
jgi:hypothetical protein